MDLANHYEKLLSPNIEGSDIWNINHNPNSYVTVSEDTLSLISTRFLMPAFLTVWWILQLEACHSYGISVLTMQQSFPIRMKSKLLFHT